MRNGSKCSGRLYRPLQKGIAKPGTIFITIEARASLREAYMDPATSYWFAMCGYCCCHVPLFGVCADCEERCYLYRTLYSNNIHYMLLELLSSVVGCTRQLAGSSVLGKDLSSDSVGTGSPRLPEWGCLGCVLASV
jgi:hypothetical protein